MSNEVEELASAKVRLRKNGELIQRIDGEEVVVATYNRDTGFLEFATKKYSVDLYNQVTAKIGTVNNGKDPSNLTIRGIGVKGEARPNMAKAPKKPKLGPLGDTAEDIVQWYLDHDLPQAIIRYGIYTDSSGKPIRKKVRRILSPIVDHRATLDDDELQWVKDSKGSQTKTPVGIEHELIEINNALVARRATALTFTPQEVVGGFTPDEDDDYVTAEQAKEDES